VVNQALASGNLVIGNPANNRSVTILSSQAACLIQKMPSGSTAAILPNGNVNCATATGSAYLSSNGRFINVLLGQTIALGLNLRNSAALASFTLTGNQFTTMAASTCSNGSPVPGTEQTFCIPSNVWNYINPKTVGKIYDLANQALGGNLPSGISISDINAAADAINRGFDKCRIVTRFSSCSGGREAEETEDEIIALNEQGVHLTAYPNPTSDETTIMFTSDRNDHATVDVFSNTGVLVARIFSGELAEGESRSVQFDVSTVAGGIYVCRFSQGDTVAYRRIIISR
jgi:hypothetical protein